MPLEVADIPGFQLDRVAVQCTHNGNAGVRTGSLSSLCCLRTEGSGKNSAGEKCRANNPEPTMLHDRSSWPIRPFRSSIHCSRSSNPSQTKQAICDTDSSKFAIFGGCG